MKNVILKSAVVLSVIAMSITTISCDLFGKKANVEPETTVIEGEPTDSIVIDSVDQVIDSANVVTPEVEVQVEPTAETK